MTTPHSAASGGTPHLRLVPAAPARDVIASRARVLSEVASVMRSSSGELGDDSYGQWMVEWAGILERRALNPIDPPAPGSDR